MKSYISDKPKLLLCCVVNPVTYKQGLLCWCCYCGQQICNNCCSQYLSEDDYYHHEECYEECPHDNEYHSEED